MRAFFTTLQWRARLAARAAAFSVIGIVFSLVGLVFLTVALWYLIAMSQGPLVAYTALGGLYLLLGIIFLAFGARTRHVGAVPTAAAVPPVPVAPREPLVQLAEGFAMGLAAGRQARRKKE